jgi:hypothetical protein
MIQQGELKFLLDCPTIGVCTIGINKGSVYSINKFLKMSIDNEVWFLLNVTLICKFMFDF